MGSVHGRVGNSREKEYPLKDHSLRNLLHCPLLSELHFWKTKSMNSDPRNVKNYKKAIKFRKRSYQLP